MPGFGKLSSSSCAVASMILSFDHSEVVAANKINMVAVEDWPDFDSKVAVKDWPDYDSETIIGDFISKNFPGDDHSRRSKLPDQIGIKPADLDPRWEEVGNGAFGIVYSDSHSDAHVLKVMNLAKIKLEKTFLEFNALKHFKTTPDDAKGANIVRTIAVGFDQDQRYAYILMEKAPGSELADEPILSRPLEDLKEIVGQAVCAVLSVHLKKYVHSDIKPSNFMWDADGKKLTLIDFGAAAQEQDHGRLAGTPLYMSPELVRDDLKKSFYEVDVWSLGVSLLKLFTDRDLIPARKNNAHTIFAVSQTYAINEDESSEKRIREYVRKRVQECFDQIESDSVELKPYQDLVLMMLEPNYEARPGLLAIIFDPLFDDQQNVMIIRREILSGLQEQMTGKRAVLETQTPLIQEFLHRAGEIIEYYDTDGKCVKYTLSIPDQNRVIVSRYSEFRKLYNKLKGTREGRQLPPFPPLSNLFTCATNDRKNKLRQYMNAVLTRCRRNEHVQAFINENGRCRRNEDVQAFIND